MKKVHIFTDKQIAKALELREARLSWKQVERIVGDGIKLCVKNAKLVASKSRKPRASPVEFFDQRRTIQLEDVTHFKAEAKYVTVFGADGTEVLTTYTLMQLTDFLRADFVKINRSVLLRRELIAGVRRAPDQYLALTLRGVDERFKVSRRNVTAFYDDMPKFKPPSYRSRTRPPEAGIIGQTSNQPA